MTSHYSNGDFKTIEEYHNFEKGVVKENDGLIANHIWLVTFIPFSIRISIWTNLSILYFHPQVCACTLMVMNLVIGTCFYVHFLKTISPNHTYFASDHVNTCSWMEVSIGA